MKVKELMILVSPAEPKERIKGGIIIPAKATGFSNAIIGKVIEAGPGTESHHMDVSNGDTILFKENPMHIEVRDYKLIPMDDVLLNYKGEYNEE